MFEEWEEGQCEESYGRGNGTKEGVRGEGIKRGIADGKATS